MNANNLLQSAIFLGAMLALVKPLGLYMTWIYENKTTGIGRMLGPIERGIYRLCGIDAREEMTWKTYAVALLIFNTVGFLLLYAMQRLQAHLPLNPAGMAAVPDHLAFNTAWSFVTNTNWQSYGGESTMSYLTQMGGLVFQNFVSAATGMAVMVALIRGMARKKTDELGSFWTDLVRGTLYLFLPLSAIFALVLVWQGVPQTFKNGPTATFLQATKDANNKPVTDQPISIGPVASQIAIKQLGTNGGGFFNANSAHPFENPTPLAGFLELLAIVLIPAASCFTFGDMIGDRRQGWMLLAAMTVIFVPLMWICVQSEQGGNPAFAKLGVDQIASATQPGGNMEGKEVRAGIVSSALWATACTATSNGSVNSMHDSYTPIGGLMPLVLIKLGEVIYGGVGTGVYGIMVFVIIAVFLAGLMVGRTPEYMGKKIEAYEVKMASIAALVPCFFILVGAAIAVVTAAGKAGMANPGAHGFSEVLYAFASAGNNNGSAFAGLTASTPFYDTLLGVTIFAARFWIIIPVLAMAGSLARKKIVPPGPGTLPTHTPLFVFFLVSVIVIVGALTFFPAWSLGPIVEHLTFIGA